MGKSIDKLYMSATQSDINMFGNNGFPDGSTTTKSSMEDELPQSLKEELNRDLSILLANTDDFGLTSDVNIDSFIDFSNAVKEETPNAYFGLTGNAITHNTLQDKSFYQHLNSQISPITQFDDINSSIKSEGTLIDSKLLEEIESVLNDVKPIGVKSPNKVVKSQISKRSQKSKVSHTTTQECAIKKSNGPSLTLPSTQSSSSNRLFKQRAMAQTAAVLATSSISTTKANNSQRNESAKAAARAVGQLVPLPRSKIANSPTMNLSLNFKNASKVQTPPRYSRNNVNMDLNFTNLNGNSPSKSSTKSHKGLNIIIPKNNFKPSSSSIISTTTGVSNKSYSSKESSTFDVPFPALRSTDTLLSQDTTNSQPQFFQSSIDYNPKFDVNVGERRNSTASSDSTSSINSLSEYLNFSTPSPTSGNLTNITFSPTNTAANRTLSFDTSPITPVSKTAARFEMLSTKSPAIESNIDTVIQNGPKMSTWKTPKNTPKQKVSLKKQKSVDFGNMKGFGVLELAVDKARLKAKPIDATIQPNLAKQDIAGRLKTNHINNKTITENNYTHTTPKPRKMRMHASSTSSSSNMSVTSTVSTVSMHSNKDEKIIPVSHLTSKSTIITNTQQIPKRKTSDVPFQSLITTFNKHEPEKNKPQIYSNMHQGLLEFQLHLDHKRGTSR